MENEKKHHGKVSTKNSELIEDIKRVAKLLNKQSIKVSEYSKHGTWHQTTPMLHFGNWNEALEAADLEVTKRWKIPEKELFENLRNIWIYKGEQPACTDVVKPISKFTTGAYLNNYGSWSNAINMFIIYALKSSIDSDNIYCNNDNDIDANDEDFILRQQENERVRLLKYEVFKKDNYKCTKCGKSPITDSKVVLHLDQIIPWSKGGKPIYANLHSFCSECDTD